MDSYIIIAYVDGEIWSSVSVSDFTEAKELQGETADEMQDLIDGENDYISYEVHLTEIIETAKKEATMH